MEDKLKHKVKTCRVIKAKMLSWTNHLGNRVVIWEDVDRSLGLNPQRKVYTFDGEINDMCEQVFTILHKNGFHPVARGFEQNGNVCVIMCDDFGDNFKHIEELT